MKTLINKLIAALSSAVLFAAAIAMAGLGLVFLGTLAVFGFLALGVALLAAPFLRLSQEPRDADTAL